MANLGVVIDHTSQGGALVDIDRRANFYGAAARLDHKACLFRHLPHGEHSGLCSGEIGSASPAKGEHEFLVLDAHTTSRQIGTAVLLEDGPNPITPGADRGIENRLGSMWSETFQPVVAGVVDIQAHDMAGVEGPAPGDDAEQSVFDMQTPQQRHGGRGYASSLRVEDDWRQGPVDVEQDGGVLGVETQRQQRGVDIGATATDGDTAQMVLELVRTQSAIILA